MTIQSPLMTINHHEITRKSWKYNFSLRLEGQLAARNLLRTAREHLYILCTTLEEMQWALTMVNDG
jgi:hypothetical protein